MHNFSVLNSRGKVNAITEIHNLNANELVLSPEGSEVIYKQPRISEPRSNWSQVRCWCKSACTAILWLLQCLWYMKCLCQMQCRTWILVFVKSSSTSDRSRSFRPAWCNPIPNCKVCFRLSSITCDTIIPISSSVMLRNWRGRSSAAAYYNCVCRYGKQCVQHLTAMQTVSVGIINTNR
jgi:hypothetical protein